LPQRQTLVCIGSKIRSAGAAGSSILSFQRADGRIEGPLTVRGGRAFVTKFRVGEEGRYGLSACETRGKNFLKNP